jgi:uncharacterized membrane protein YhdT
MTEADWILLCVTLTALLVWVGVVACKRDRNGVRWFVLAVLISPLIAGLLLLALPRVPHYRKLTIDEPQQ